MPSTQTPERRWFRDRTSSFLNHRSPDRTSMSTSTDQQTAVRYEKDADGIVTLTLDDPTASANTMNELYLESMAGAVRRLYDEQDDVTGVVIASAKKTFFAGGNLKNMVQATKDD